MKNSFSILVIIVIILFNCKNESKNEKDNYSEKVIKLDFKNKKNDNFRIFVIKNIEDSQNKKIFEKYADKLDEENISFENFMSKELSSEDSCYDVANKKFPDPSMQIACSEFVGDLIKQVELKYQKKYNLTKKEFNDITTIWAFNKDARKLVEKN